MAVFIVQLTTQLQILGYRETVFMDFWLFNAHFMCLVLGGTQTNNTDTDRHWEIKHRVLEVS